MNPENIGAATLGKSILQTFSIFAGRLINIADLDIGIGGLVFIDERFDNGLGFPEAPVSESDGNRFFYKIQDGSDNKKPSNEK